MTLLLCFSGRLLSHETWRGMDNVQAVTVVFSGSVILSQTVVAALLQTLPKSVMVLD